MILGLLIHSFYNDTMARFYNPRQGEERRPIEVGYDPTTDAGTSGAEVSDLRPEQAYDTDLRRLSADERPEAESLNDNQNRVAKFMRAARSAGAYKQRASIDEPMIRGRTPRVPASINGVALPTRGDSGGRSGAIGYADKPRPLSGKSYSYLDSFG